jgi:Cys-rich protein (TIGR01571 family)
MKGQVLIVPFNLEAKMSTDRAWKDSLFACTRYGLIHPSLLCACCCPLILLGQIMTRLKMDWKGNEASPVEWNKTFRTMLLVGLFCKFFLVSMSDILDAILEWSYFFYLVYLLIKVRKYVRDRDQIPSEGYTTWEDIGVSIWCIPCAASQLARQTANYDQEIAYFLTQDGLSPNRARAVTTDNEYAGEIV